MAFGPIEAAAENREIAADMADDLVAALTRAGISVVTGTRAARHLLTAAIRGTGVHTQLVVRLIDTETGRQLWAHRADGVLRDETASSEHLAVRIAAALQPCLRLAEIDHALRKPAACLGAYDLALRAMPGVLSLDANGNARALELLDRALQMDPDHPLATALAAWAHVQRVVYHFTSAPSQERTRSLELVHKARTLRNDATVLAILGNALSLLNEFDAADLVTRKALAIDGGSAWAGAYFLGIATVRPVPSGRGTAACEATTASMRARMSGGKGATLRAFMSMWSVMFSEVAESQPSVAWRNSSNVCSRFSS